MFFKQHEDKSIRTCNSLITAEQELTEENHADYTYPTIAGWHWFETPAKAYQFFTVETGAITSLQAMLAINQFGKAASFNNWLATLDPITDFEMLSYFTKSTIWHRDHPVLITSAASLGLTDHQVDNLFELAKSL